jgi:pimeloyl-ACP methyl ester carboxylesterase
VRLHLLEYGAGEPLVCLHGLQEGGAHFEPLAARLAGRRLLAPDLRGHGASGREPPWRIEQHLEDVLDTVGEEGGRDWCGHSFGGRLCVELANRRPELVRRLVLLDPALRLQPKNALRLAEEERAGDGGLPRSRAAVAALFGELARPSPPFPRVPTLLVLGGRESVVGPNRRRLYAEALGPLLETVVVAGGHTMLRDAFDETAGAISAWLARPLPA